MLKSKSRSNPETPGIDSVNALERRIVVAEDDADAMLWDQARHVVALLASGWSQRQVAAQWMNVRVGAPYSAMHVYRTAEVVTLTLQAQPRPRFRDVYNQVANRKCASTPEDAIPFHWMNWAEALYRRIARDSNAWPDDLRRALPEILRRLADQFEREGTYASRRQGVDGAGAGQDRSSAVGTSDAGGACAGT
jgi:hypothetical protein